MSGIGFGDRALARELLRVRARSFAARIEAVGSGRWTEIAGAFAFDWNGYRYVHGFDRELLPRLGELLDWFGGGLAPRIETDCGEALPLIGETLDALGYRPFHAHALYVAELARLEPMPAETADLNPIEFSPIEFSPIVFSPIVFSYDPRDFGRVGAQLWSDGDPKHAEALTREHQGSRWRCTSVLVDGQPVAAASLFCDDDHAYHANALTLPEQRGRGHHGRLIAEQIAYARERGLRWFVADTQVGSGSGRNLERGGLRCVSTCLTWQPRQLER